MDVALGMKTGIYDLDYMMDGLHRGEVTIIGGRPAMGKTMLALNMANSMAKDENLSVAYLSLAESENTVVTKLLAMNAAVPINNIVTGDLDDDYWNRIIVKTPELKNMGFRVAHSVDLSATNIEMICRKNEGLDVVFIDYLQLMIHSEDSENRMCECRKLISDLKRIAKSYSVSIILLSQLYAQLENRIDKRPQPIDFMDLDLKAPFNNLIGIYRDEYYNCCTVNRAILEIIVLANRRKSIGTCITAYLPEFCKVANLS